MRKWFDFKRDEYRSSIVNNLDDRMVAEEELVPRGEGKTEKKELISEI